MNTTHCVACGEPLGSCDDDDYPVVRRDRPGQIICDDDRCREIVRLRDANNDLRHEKVYSSIRETALRTTLHDLRDPNTAIPPQVQRRAAPVCDYIDAGVEFWSPEEAYLYYLAIARHVDEAMVSAQAETERAA